VGIRLPGAEESLDAFERAQQNRKEFDEVSFKVLMCGPVMQGVVGPNAKIIVVQNRLQVNGSSDLLPLPDDDTGSIVSSETDVADSAWLDNLLPRFHGGVSQVPGLHHSLPEDIRDVPSDLPNKPLPSIVVSPHALQLPYPTSKLHPPPPSDEDEHSRILVNVGDLAKIGCLSGDYVLLRSNDATEEQGRICRVYGIEGKAKKGKEIAV